VNDYQVFGPVCAWTHVLALVIVLASPVVIHVALRWAIHAIGSARRRAGYRRQWAKLAR